MTDQVATRDTQNVAPAAGSFAIIPRTINEAWQVAKIMAGSRLVPKPLQDQPSDCFLVVEQAMRWNMSPFAVAQEVSVISGKLMYSGKMTAAAIQSAPGVLQGRLHYAYDGEGEDRKVTVSGVLRGEPDQRSVEVKWRDAKTDNQMWKKQPDQQLAYHGARVWARRYAPEVMLGVYSPEEMPDEPIAVYSPLTPQQIARDRNAAAVARAQHIIEHGNGQGTTKATKIQDAPADPHPELEGDGIPALDEDPRLDLTQPDDPLHDEVEVAIKKFARVTTADVFQRGMASVQDLLRRCDDAERGELKMMLLETMSAARKRVAEATPQNAENLS
jgi:hypothetical protein